MATTIKCKYCGKEIEITEALRHQIENEILSSEKEKHKEELQRVAEEAEKNFTTELLDLKKELSEKDQKIDKMREEELKIREEKRKIEEEKKDLELEVERRLDAERKGIEEKAKKDVEEKFRYQELQKNKEISDLKMALDEAQRKANITSQQLQGEVVELDFEEQLKQNFPNDDIQPVEKGVRGADIQQTVKSPRGVVCGVILWETKKTKAWTDSWIEKLKEDLRLGKANIPVIVTSVLPKEIENGLGFKNGVWISNFSLAIPLASLLRKNLIDIGYQKFVSEHMGEKADHLYSYITSHEFRQQVETMVESYFRMKSQIIKEKTIYEKIWKEREREVEKLLSSTANVVGSIQGEIGQTEFQIKGLELLELEPGQKDN